MEIIKLITQLRERYNKCNSEGHLKPDKQNNYCNHCYRHLEYHQLENQDTLQFGRKKRRYIKMQMRVDYNNGLKRLEEEI